MHYVYLIGTNMCRNVPDMAQLYPKEHNTALLIDITLVWVYFDWNYNHYNRKDILIIPSSPVNNTLWRTIISWRITSYWCVPVSIRFYISYWRTVITIIVRVVIRIIIVVSNNRSCYYNFSRFLVTWGDIIRPTRW